MANRTKFTQEKKEQLCKAIRDTGNISKACDICCVSRRGAYDAKEADTEFSKEWEEAVEESIELMEAEARRRAFEGVLEPVFYQGEECGTIRKYSDTLLMFILKAKKPKEYRDNQRVVLAGDKENPLHTTYHHDPARAAEEIISAQGSNDEN
jgi:hypothetical protein